MEIYKLCDFIALLQNFGIFYLEGEGLRQRPGYCY